MLVDAFLPNLLVFLAGQAAAWYYLRTGRLWIGGVAMAVIWVAADWAVIAHYVFERRADFEIALWVMQITAVLVVIALGWALARRRWSATARQRPDLFRQGIRDYLGGKHEAARTTFRRLLAADPWDAAAWLALGNVLRRLGREPGARRAYGRCLRVDLSGEYTDLAREQLRTQPVRADAADRRITQVTGASARSDRKRGQAVGS